MGNQTAVASDKFALANHLNPQDPYILWNWGKTLGDSGCHQAAIDKCRQALTIEPENTDAHLYLADNLVAIDNVDEALNHYKEAIKLAPKDPWPHVSLANVMIKHDNYAEAEEHYRQAAKLAANDEGTLISLYDSWGFSLGRRNLHKEAEEIYRKGLEIKTDIGILARIGSELAKQGRLDNARKLFQQAEQLGPKTDYECGGLGWGFYQLGDYDKSLHYSRRCLELRPDALYARCNAGAALIHLGRPEEARNEYERAIQTAEQTTDADEFQYHAGDLEQALKDAPDLPGGKEILETLQKHLERIRELRKRSRKVQNTII